MTKKDKILAIARQKGSITSREAAKTLKVSRVYAQRLLRELQTEGSLLHIGKTRQSRYVPATDETAIKKARKSIRHIRFTLSNDQLSEDRILARIEKETGILIDVPENVSQIFKYGFTEMLNNAIEHSESTQINIDCRRSDTAITFVVRDFGIGIFNNVRDKFRLPNTLAAIQEILKGKITTDPENHSGQGVFFTSKSADMFIADSYDKQLLVNNLLPDIFIRDRRELKGTRITFSINLSSSRELRMVFENFTGGEDGLEFDKTHITLKLFQFGRTLMSRSEAKRVTLNLDNFREVELDFTDVETVGQGFADEIFRVWQNRHPDVHLVATHANDNVAFMITRAGGEIGQDKLTI